MLHGSVGLFSFHMTETQSSSACLSSRDDSQSKACFLVWWLRHLIHYSDQETKEDVRVEPWSIRSSITARMGATPVPGPTQIIGMVVSFGSVIKPLLSPILSESPVQRQHSAYEYTGFINSRRFNIPGCKAAKNVVHTPLLGILNFVRYLTIATHKCIWCGWRCANPGS